jgi:hypothetical protein
MEMKKGIVFGLAGLLVFSSAAANARTNDSQQTATVVRVEKVDSGSSFVGSNPTDAPLRSDLYLYSVWLKVNCATYAARYESSADQPPPIFTPERHLGVRVGKHVLHASVPGAGDLRLSIIGHKSDTTGPCAQP